MRTAGILSTVTAFVIGALVIRLIGDGLIAFLFGVPIGLWPLAVSLQLGLRCRGIPKAQGALAVGSCLYALWFLLVCADAFFWHPDAQSGIVILFVAFYS